jgi:Family of unknown function (DUF6166)
MKVYTGVKQPDGTGVVLVDGAPLYHVQHRSDRFDWGYIGDGPADLALSILADHFGERPTADELQHPPPGDVSIGPFSAEQPTADPLQHARLKCWQLHRAFKRDVIAGFPREPGVTWELTSEEIDAWLADWALDRWR